MRELVDTLIDREHATDTEQDDCNYERVDVPFATVSERMLLVGLAFRNVRPAQQQYLITGVRNGVHGLREH